MDTIPSVTQDRFNRIQGAKLIVQNKRFSIYKGVNIIGRNKSATVDLKNLNVSQYHAMIIIVDDSQHFISDLNSSNGTYLLGNKIVPFKLYELPNDTEIRFGDVNGLYLKPDINDDTVHLEHESMEVTQSLTQTFYAAKTQLMFSDCTLNETVSTNLTGPSTSAMEIQDIHEAATQVVPYPPTINRSNIEINKIPSVTEEIISDIHNDLTQVIPMPQQPSTSRASEENIHEVATQIIDFPNKTSFPLHSEENMHKMLTQVEPCQSETNEFDEQAQNKCSETTNSIAESKFESEKKINFSINQNSVIEESVIEESVVEEPIMEAVEEKVIQMDTDENSNDSVDFLSINRPPDIGINTQNNIHPNQNDDNNSETQDIGKPIKRTVRKLSSSEEILESQKKKEVCNSDSETDIDDVDIEKMRNASQKLNSMQTQNMEGETSNVRRKSFKKIKVINSDSETDIEDDKYQNISMSQSDDVIKPKILSKKLNFNSDSETDIEDNKQNSPVRNAVQDDDSTSTEMLNDTDCIPATQDAFANMFQYKTSTLLNSNHTSSVNVSSEDSFKLGLTELMVDENDVMLDQNNKESRENSPILNKKLEQINETISEINRNNNKKLVMPLQETNDKQCDKSITNKNAINNEKCTTNMGTDDEKQLEDLYMMPTQKINCNNSNIQELVIPLQETNDKQYDKSITDKNALNNEKCTTDMSTDNEKCTKDMVTDNEKQLEDLYMISTQKINCNNSNEQEEATCSVVTQETEVKDYMTTLSGLSKEKDDTQNVNYSHTCGKPEDILSMATQPVNQVKGTVLATDQEKELDEDVYMMPTQKINEAQQPNYTEEEDVYLQVTQDINQLQNAPSTSKSLTHDEDLYLMPTQIIGNTFQQKEVTKNVNQGNHASNISVDHEKKEDEDLYMMPTQKINEDEGIFKAPQKFTFKKKTPNLDGSLTTILGGKSEDDPYSVETQQINDTPQSKCNKSDIQSNINQEDNLSEAKNKTSENPTKDDYLYLQPTQELNLVSLTNKQNNYDDPYLEATQKLDESPIKENCINVVEGVVTEKIYVKETPTQLFMSNQEIMLQSKSNHQTSDQNENNPYEVPTQPMLYMPKCQEVASTSKEIFTKIPRDNSLTEVTKEETNSSLKRLGDPTQDFPRVKKIKKSDTETLKKSVESHKVDAETLSQIEAFVKMPLHKSEKDDRVETLSQIDAFIKTSLRNDKTTSENNGQNIPDHHIPKFRNVKKSDIENLKQTIESNKVDDAETLSQIEAFIKKPLHETERDDQMETKGYGKITRNKVISAANKNKDISSVSQKEEVGVETSQIEVFMKKPLDPKAYQLSNVKNDVPSETDKKSILRDKAKQTNEEDKYSTLETVGTSKNLLRKTRGRQSRIIEEEKEDRIDNLKSIDRSIEVKNKILNEESGGENLDENNDKNINKLNSEQDTIKSDVDQSFALLEAKSTKIRKSRRITDAGEVKVAVRKNRRSMTTSSIAELQDGITKKLSTRKSQRVLNNNIEPSSAAKVDNSSQEKSIRGFEAKHKFESSNSDSAEPEIPAKIVKTNVTRIEKTKAKVVNKDDNKDKGTSNKENSETSEHSMPTSSKTNTRIKATNSEDKEKTADKRMSSKNPSLTPTSKGTSTRVASNTENISTPTTSKVRLTSKMKNKLASISESSSCDSGSVSSNDLVLATPSRRGRSSALIDTPSTERSKRKLRPKVVFTMLDNPQLESLIRQLGGSMVDTVDSCTVLVTEHVKRSQKLLTAVGQGKPICSPNWIYASKKANDFLDPWEFILVDKEAESKWNFSLKNSITKAANEKLLTNYTFQLLVSNAADVLKGAIEACGGKCVKTSPKNVEGFLVVVASPENRNKYLKIKKQNPETTVVEPEAIFDGVLRQELRLGRHLLT